MKRSKETIKVIIITTLVTSIGFATTLETTIKADVKDDSTCIELNTNNENSIINTLRLKWKEDLTVGSKMDVKNSAIAKKISWYEKQTDNCLKSMNENPDNDWLWENLKEYKDKPSQITSMFNNILSMATSYNLPNNKYYKNKELKNKIIFALEWINKNAYNENIEQYGNWWDWVIGIPARLNNTTILMYDDLSQDQIKRYMDAIQKFLPIIDPGSKYHTGANLADVCINKLLQGVISKDPSKIKEASEDIEGVFEYVTNGDGFYADGSYVQHGIVAYTGSYGNVLIDKISNIMFLLEGTPWSVKSQSKNNVYKWIFESFDPIIYKGYVMDMVRGRSISRYNGNGYMRASGIIEGMIKLSMISDEDTSKKVQALVKEWANEAEEIIDFGTRFKSINVINKFYQFMKDDSIVATKQEAKHNALNMMDKTIHEREDYALSISRSSSRISKYEFMNKENLKPWFQGDGMTYLHNDDLTQFSDDFWPTIDPYRMPGTTIDKRLRKDKEILPGIDPGSSDQDEVYYELGNSNWSGGSKLGIYGISGMKIDNKYDSLTANKSWFMFDDEIVALGSDITNPEEYDNETIIENRKIKKDGSNRFIVDGEEKIKTLGDSDKVENAKWAYLEGNVSNSNIGYYFPDGADINILRDNREGNWFNINSSKAEADKVVTNNYLTMYINHGSKIKNEKYSYVLLPNKSVEEVKSYSEKSNIEILRNDEIAQGVKHLGLKMEGANFFVDGENTSGSITSTGNSSIMIKENNDKTLTIAVSDPTFQENNISVQINRKGAEVVSSDNEIANINLNNNKISFDVNTTDAKGKTFELVVKLVEDGSEEKQQIKNEVPVINGEDVNLTVGEKWNKNLHKIVATDKEDGDLTEKVRIKENNIKLNNDSIVTESGEYNVVFEVEDKDGVKTEKTFKVNVKDRNQAPVINGEDVNLTVGDKWNKNLHKIVVIDKEDGDLTEKVRIKENNIKLNNDSIVTESGEYNVVFEVEDKDGDKTEKTFKVNVKDRNQAPVINGEDVNLTVGEKWNKNLHKIVATDKEDGDLTEKVRIKENNIKLNNDSIVTESGEYNVVFEVEDKDGDKTEKTFKVNVKDRNQAPVINGEDVNLTVGEKWNKNLHKIVVIDKEDGDLTEKVRIKENNIKLNNDSIVTESGEYNVVFEVEDKDGDKTEKTFKVNVKDRNQAPVINGEDVNLTVGEKWNKNLHKIVATDKEDGDLTEKVRIKENNIKLNNDSIVTESGEYNVVFEVEDKDGDKTEKTFKVNVKDRNQAPVINGEDVNLTVGEKWNKNLHKIVVIDKEDGDLTEKVRIKENNIKLNNDSIVTESGEYNVVFEVEDKDGDKTEKTFKVNVKDRNQASVINGEDVNLTVGEKWNKNLHKIVVIDKEDGDLTEKVRIKENNIKLNNDSIVTESGEYNVVFEVEDKDGVKTEKTFKVNVKDRNQAPVINGEDVNLTVGEKWNKNLHKIVAIDKEDGDLTEKVRIKENNIKLNNDSIVTESGEYNVVFEVEDKDGVKTEKTFKVNVENKSSNSNKNNIGNLPKTGTGVGATGLLAVAVSLLGVGATLFKKKK